MRQCLVGRHYFMQEKTSPPGLLEASKIAVSFATANSDSTSEGNLLESVQCWWFDFNFFTWTSGPVLNLAG